MTVLPKSRAMLNTAGEAGNGDYCIAGAQTTAKLNCNWLIFTFRGAVV